MMSDPTAQARQSFGDVLALVDLEAVDGTALVPAATELLVVGCDAEAVVSLACVVVSPPPNPFELVAVVEDAREYMGMPPLDPAATRIRAAQGQVRRWRRGLLTDRQLARWAGGFLNLEEHEVLADLYVVDIIFDELPYVDATLGSIHRDLEQIADRLLALPDPWR